jgi:hypothetical protein
MYVEGNPINYVDPTGMNPNCTEPPRGRYPGGYCALQRFNEILKASGANGAQALVEIFSDDELQNVWGRDAGTTSAARLEWLLRITRGDANYVKSKIVDLPIGIYLQFGVLFPTSCTDPSSDSDCDCGISIEFEDSEFYKTIPAWGGGTSHQINHFLSAVAEYYYEKDLRLIIAHEMSGDEDEWENLNNFVTPADYYHFQRAWYFDTNGMYTERDEELWEILDFDPIFAPRIGNVDFRRRGNSLQDLRLSLRGVRFAAWVSLYKSSNPKKAAEWLTVYLLHQ